VTGAATPEELAAARQWFASAFEAGLAGEAEHRFPIAFSYGEADWPAAFDRAEAQWSEPISTPEGERRTLTLIEPQSGLQVRCEITIFRDHPVVEWVACLANTGGADTPIIADLHALSAVFPLAKDAPARVHHALGSQCGIDDFAPRETPLTPGASLTLEPSGSARSSDGALPFFNLEMGDGGVIGAIGWTGAWKADFQRSAEGKIALQAGMRRMHLRLLPSEEIRTPRIMLLFWRGDRWRGQNLLRRFLLAHHAPPGMGRPAGSALPPIAIATWGENTAANQIAKARWWKENDIGVDCYWIDAGWHGDAPYLADSTVFNSRWWAQVGNWTANPATYPQGMGEVGDAIRELGFDFVLWLEPERAYKDTFFPREHPEWLLGPVGDNYLFNLGQPEARRALTDVVSGVIGEGRVTWYRQDFNMDPAPFWEAADAPDRVGMSEIRHIEGLYAFWDELLARHPGLRIDNCSSGGRRIDLETVSRSVPLWRSDYPCFLGFDPIGVQGETQGLAPWVPFSTGACESAITYNFRSALGTGIILCNDYSLTPPPPWPAEWLRERVAELRAVRPYFLGDFYALVSHSVADDAWAAWQYDRPDLGEGMVLALRRQKSPFPIIEARLRGLDPDARYEVRRPQGDAIGAFAGRDLMEKGFEINIAERPGSELLVYKRMG